jgi:HSP20 family molecular chaperone IbpA
MYFPFSDFFCFDDSTYRFNRPMLERQGWYSVEKDGRLLVLLNILGVDKDNLNVEVKSASDSKQLISISGNTKNEIFDKDFSVNMNFTVGKPMEELLWDVKNGFLTLDIKFQEPVKPAVKVIRK